MARSSRTDIATYDSELPPEVDEALVGADRS